MEKHHPVNTLGGGVERSLPPVKSIDSSSGRASEMSPAEFQLQDPLVLQNQVHIYEIYQNLSPYRAVYMTANTATPAYAG